MNKKLRSKIFVRDKKLRKYLFSRIWGLHCFLVLKEDSTYKRDSTYNREPIPFIRVSPFLAESTSNLSRLAESLEFRKGLII